MVMFLEAKRVQVNELKTEGFPPKWPVYTAKTIDIGSNNSILSLYFFVFFLCFEFLVRRSWTQSPSIGCCHQRHNWNAISANYFSFENALSVVIRLVAIDKLQLAFNVPMGNMCTYGCRSDGTWTHPFIILMGLVWCINSNHTKNTRVPFVYYVIDGAQHFSQKSKFQFQMTCSDGAPSGHYWNLGMGRWSLRVPQ